MKTLASPASRILQVHPVRLLAVPVLVFLLAGAAILHAGRTLAAATPVPATPEKSLIYAGWYGNTIPTPSFIQQNFAFLESQPFHGLAVYMRNPSLTINATTAVMKSTPISYESISSVLAPMSGLEFSRLRDNFGVVMGSAPPDFFDSWTTTIQNFANLAAAARDAGLRGFIFDNEQYFSSWGNYPSGVAYPGTSLAQYQAQAVLRGRQVMQAMVVEFPEIIVLTLHGPYVSEPAAPEALHFPQWQSGNELLGPFFAGFQEGSSFPGQNVDGGEMYDLRSASEFQAAYDWRRYDLPSAEVDCAFISSDLRSAWPESVSISYGVYDCPFGGAAMTPSILTSTLQNALARADRWVWFYAEDNTYLRPPGQGGASDEWVAAVRAAWPAAVEPAPAPILPPPALPMEPEAAAAPADESHSSRCGLLGIEVAPIFFALAFLRRRRRRT